MASFNFQTLGGDCGGLLILVRLETTFYRRLARAFERIGATLDPSVRIYRTFMEEGDPQAIAARSVATGMRRAGLILAVPDHAEIREAVATLLFYGAFELHLYVLKRQERRFKYNGKFPSEQKSKAFWFESQNVDNILRTFLSGVAIWTAVEVLVLWAFANGYAPWLSFAQHPVYLAALAWSCRSSTSSTSSASIG